MAYSYDGIVWNSSTPIFDTICYTFAWNGSLWVAGGIGGTRSSLAYSYNGIDWLSSTSSLFDDCVAVAWNGALWVATGDDGGLGRIAYSFNGIDWFVADDSLFGAGSGTALASRRPLPYVGTTIVPPLLNQAPLIGPTGGALIFTSPTGTHNLYYSRFLDISENGGTGSLNIQGTLTVSGSISKATSTFLIPHPDPSKTETHLLRHCVVESPTRGDNLYRWTLTTTNRIVEQSLPSYSPFLNENWQFFVRPTQSFGRGYAVLAEDERSFRLNVSEDGTYHVLGIATRKDAAAKAFFDGKGVEFLRDGKI